MKTGLAITISSLALVVLAVEFGVRVIARAEGPLEPSIQNEVDHAVALAEEWLSGQTPCTNAVIGDVFGTNGTASADLAIRLVSSQNGKGWWITPTNSAPTRLAVEILKGL